MKTSTTKMLSIFSLSVLALLTACADNQEISALESALEEARAEIASLSAQVESFEEQAAIEEEAREVVGRFFAPGTDMLELLHEDYTQHNPVFKRFGEMNGITGKDEARVLFSFFFSQAGDEDAPPPPAPDPNQPQGNPNYLILADGDVGVVLQQRWVPDPMNEGEYYEAFWFDAWRVRDGQLYEHWDAALIEEPLPPFLQAPLGEEVIEAALGGQ